MKWFVIIIVMGGLIIAGEACQQDSPKRAASVASKSKNDDAAESRAAFLAVYPVFMHPRCMNCHPVGDQPLQGDDSHIHSMNIQRGDDGRGVYALKCANCHQLKNLPGDHMPPGHPDWHLPPANMKMVFQGKSPAELARQMKDPKLNGGKSFEELIHHISADSLVIESGWNPGNGRAKVPMPHDEFAAKFREWIEKGAAIPE
ncbi:hypothetical protein BH09PLA1_BH09PLA1_35940 [soil metagenome]